jgi:ATP-dependent helicase/nuclease subunit A
MPEPTEEQRLAVEHRATSVVLSSGAGCGKTAVLTKRFVSHLEKDKASVGQIVAITFTDKAARAMRDRIRKEIQTLTDCAKHLRDLERAQITTIHSFCGNVLRQFAIPAGLDPAFEVLDDVLATNLRAEALTAGLHGLLEDRGDEAAASSLRKLIVWFGYPAVEDAVDSLLFQVDRPTWRKWLARKPSAIAAEWTGPARRELLPRWVAYLCAASPKMARAMAVLEGIRGGSAVVKNKVERLLAELPRLHEAHDLPAKLEELRSLAMVKDIKKADKPDEATYEALKGALKDLREELDGRFEVFTAGSEGVAEAAAFGQHFLRVALAVDDEYRARKERAGVLDFQDLLILARDLVRDDEEVRTALRKRYRFILLDELQDTDPVQMELVELICGDELRTGKLFAVGDHKQSIYRFRGAEVELFTRLSNLVANEGRLALSLNFRSQPGIIRFVNAFFARRLEEYRPLVAERPAVGAGANVEFLWTVAEGSVGDFRAAEADAIAQRIVELLADETPQLLGENGGPPRRVQPGDISLLFRSMTNVAVYETALRRHGLDYYLIGGRAFFAQQEVYDLLNLLRAVENPQDSLSLVGALRSPFFNLSDESLVLLARHEDGIWAGLRDEANLAVLPPGQRPAAERAIELLTVWRSLKDRLPIAPLINRVLADTGYDAALQFEFLGERKLANLWKLIDLARSFDQTGLFGLHEFTARLGDLVSRQPREEQAATVPEKADVIRLMSIHQSKGLEFPVVFVADFAATRQGGRSAVARWHRTLGCLVRVPSEFDNQPEEEARPFAALASDLGRTADQLADWQEDLRILYVACTRAIDRLILSAAIAEADGPLPANHWTLALAERFNVRTGECIAADVKPADAPAVRVKMMKPEPREHAPVVKEERDAPVATLDGMAHPRRRLPAVISVAALEAIERGEVGVPLTPQFATEDDSDLTRWRTPRERVGPVAPAEGILWDVLERWDFRDADGWVQLLGDALENAGDNALAETLRSQLARLAESSLRQGLAGASEVHRNIEYLADLGAIHPFPEPFKLRGVIDLLVRDRSGWRIVAIDRGTAHEDDPWRGRRPGLVIQASVASKQFGEWPATIELFDLATGQHLQLDPRRLSVKAAAEHFIRCANSVLR